MPNKTNVLDTLGLTYALKLKKVIQNTDLALLMTTYLEVKIKTLCQAERVEAILTKIRCPRHARTDKRIQINDTLGYRI